MGAHAFAAPATTPGIQSRREKTVMGNCIVVVQFDLPKRTEEDAIKGGTSTPMGVKKSLRMQQIAHVAGSATRPGCAAEEASQVLCRP